MAGQTASLTTSIVETEEQPFVPGGATISAVLQPSAAEDPYSAPEAPANVIPEEDLLDWMTETTTDRPLIVNVESTGLMPFDSAISSICCMDPLDPRTFYEFYGSDEGKIIADFWNFWTSKGFNRMVGYQVSFDFRFIFAKAMRYGLELIDFDRIALTDVMQIMQQVKEAFVYGTNKAGTLDEWANYILGMQPPFTQADVIAAYPKKDWDKIREYNKYKCTATYGLYAAATWTLRG
jgi:hypothetical protein